MLIQINTKTVYYVVHNIFKFDSYCYQAVCVQMAVIDNLTLSFYHLYICITGIAADVTDSALQSLLQTLPGMGGMSVSRSGLCHSYVWTADWLQVGGDRPPITLDTRNIQVYTSPELQRTTAV